MRQNKWIRRSGITVARTIGRDVWSDWTRKGFEAAVTDVWPGGGVARLLVGRAWSRLVTGRTGGRLESSVLDLRRGGEGGGGGGGGGVAGPAVGQSGGERGWAGVRGVAREGVGCRHGVGPHWLLVAGQAQALLLKLLVGSQRLAQWDSVGLCWSLHWGGVAGADRHWSIGRAVHGLGSGY